LRPLPLSLYAAAAGLAEPFAHVLLRSRARKGKEDPARLPERLGRPTRARPAGPLVWLHGVSVGESVSLLPLVGALRRKRPDLALLVTSGTRTSAELLARRLPPEVIHQYAPVDGPGAAARFLDHWKPALGIFAESELWPNLIAGAQARQVKLALVSARMTQKSADGWLRAPASARALLSAFHLVLPQDGETEDRLRRLGARIDGRANLKLVGDPLPVDADELARLRGAVGARRVLLAASTHAGEEAILARAFQAMGRTDTLFVVAPRHPDRGPEVAALFAGRKVARRGAGETPGAETEIYVADTLGEMGLLFRLADAAFMGGSLLPGIGGHNPLEPARLGVPMVTGRHVFNNAAAFAEMFVEVAALEAADEAALVRHLNGLVGDARIARRIGEAALAFAERQQGALDEAMAKLAPLLPA
jgi:3-deoxy-D-manno-octulosonic-acid transferase